MKNECWNIRNTTISPEHEEKFEQLTFDFLDKLLLFAKKK